jgi:hypothetical protein
MNQHVKQSGPIQTFYTAHNSLFTVVSAKRLSAFSQLTSHSSFSTTHSPQQLFSQPQLNQTHPKLDRFLACLLLLADFFPTTDYNTVKVFLACFFSTSPPDFFPPQYTRPYCLLPDFPLSADCLRRGHQPWTCPHVVDAVRHATIHAGVKHNYHRVE